MSNLLPRNSSILAASLLVVLLCLGASIPAAAQGTRVSPVAIENLIKDLQSPSSARRKEAACTLGEVKAQQATPALVAAASDPDAAVRKEIVAALDKMLDIRALPAFVQLTADPDRDIRDRSVTGIMNLYLPQESGLAASLNKVGNFMNPWSDEWADVVVEPGIAVDPSAVAALSDRLKDADNDIRLKAARGLGFLKASAAVSALAGALGQNQTNTVRFEIIRALAKIGDVSAVPDLMNYLSYNDAKVRNEAIYALGVLHDRRPVPEMTRLFDREMGLPVKLIDRPFLEAILGALARIADPSSRPIFLNEKQDPSNAMRLHAYEGLARLADASIVTDVSRAWLHETDPEVRTAQAYCLFRMGRREFLDEVTRALGDGKTHQVAREYLMETTAQDLPELYAQTKSDSVAALEGLAEIFGLIGDRRAVPVLLELANDRRGQIAALANQAIRRINARFS